MSCDLEMDTGGGGLNHHNQQWSIEDGRQQHHLRAIPSCQQQQQQRQRCACCNRCWTAGCTWLTSALGVSVLLFVYLITGAIMFMTLGNQQQVDGSKSLLLHHPATGQRVQHADADGRLLDKTMATVDRLWSITEDLNILYRDNWTHLARVEMRHYQDQMVHTLRQILLEERYSFKQTWTFAMSLLYALTLITTIGYGFYTPTTMLAKSLTTAYSLVGIPLFLLYLSVVGERMARVINRMTLSCCCCCNDNMAVTSADDEDEEDIGRAAGRRRIGGYRQYSDVTIALQPMSLDAGNGHVPQPFKDDAPTTNLSLLNSPVYNCWPSDSTVPLLVCAALLAVFIGLASLLLVLFEPQLGFFGSLQLTVNLLMTLGFAGNLLPGMSDESDDTTNHHGVASQISLVIVACLILVGTTLLSSSFTVLMDNISQTRSSSAAADPIESSRRCADSTCYHHMPPGRQLS